MLLHPMSHSNRKERERERKKYMKKGKEKKTKKWYDYIKKYSNYN